MKTALTYTFLIVAVLAATFSAKKPAVEEARLASRTSTSIDFSSNLPASGTFPDRWIHGSESAMDNEDPPVQVHAYNAHTFILRENKAINYEGVFMYLYFGNDKAVLFDQGSTANPVWFPLRKIVDEIIAQWLKDNGKDDITLIVAHTHLHGDHIAAYNQFVDRPNTILVGITEEEQIAFWGFKNYPYDTVTYDLGGRTLTLLGAPGHHPSEFNIYDSYTHLMITGDMFYRGRLYIRNWEDWSGSILRLVDFAKNNPVSHFVNCHIEMTATPRLQYRIGTNYQPKEPPMQMSMDHLLAVRDAIFEVNGVPGAHIYNDFILMNMVPGASDPY